MARILEARNNPRVKEHAPKSSSQQLIVGNFVCAQVKQQHFGTFPLGEVNIAHAAQLEPIACRQALIWTVPYFAAIQSAKPFRY